MMTTAPQARDPGLQPERTQLSWQRTALSMLILSVVMMRTGLVRLNLLLMAASALSITMAFLLLFISYRQRDVLYSVNRNVSMQGKRLIMAILSLNALILATSHLI